MDKIFTMRSQQKLRINDFSQIDVCDILDNTYSTTVVNCGSSKNKIETVNLIFHSFI